jgi:hypothetical protein
MIVMGEVEKGEQNNFSISRLNPYWIMWHSFCEIPFSSFRWGRIAAIDDYHAG